MRTLILLVLAVALTLIGQFAFAQGQNSNTIYGTDGRRDFYQLPTLRLRTLAKKSVALISTASISNAKTKQKLLKGRQYGENSRLCLDEKFFDQPSIAFCSGVLIGPRHVLTAGHCFPQATTCAETSFVLDYLIENVTEQTQVFVPPSSIYGCAQVVKKVISKGIDFAVVELDRPVRDRRAVPMKGEVSHQSQLLTIGFPAGIPLKAAFGGRIRRETTNFIVANSDVLRGNSGSPVYNEELELVGLLLRGEADYQFDRSRGCYLDRRCKEDACMGETIIKTSTIIERLGPEFLTQI